MTTSTIRLLGVAVAFGGMLWGLAWIVSPSAQGDNSPVEIWASAVFQLGLVALLSLMWLSAATGVTRAARLVLAIEAVALALAFAWTVPYLFDANRPMTGVLLVLDVFWPLSMLGLVVVGAMTWRAQRWPAPLRYAPLVASLLLVVDLAVAATGASDAVRDLTTGLYLALAYGALGGLIVVSAPRLPREPDAHPDLRVGMAA